MTLFPLCVVCKEVCLSFLFICGSEIHFDAVCVHDLPVGFLFGFFCVLLPEDKLPQEHEQTAIAGRLTHSGAS